MDMLSQCGMSPFPFLALVALVAAMMNVVDTKAADSTAQWVLSYYASGEVEWKTPYVNGREHGLQTRYRLDGSIERTVALERGIKNGIETQFYENGKPMLEIPYENGRLSGDLREYYDNGQLERVTPYLAGLQHGLQRVLDRRGSVLHEEKWVKGTGVDHEYDDQGRLRRETSYRDGMKHGAMREYDAKGNITRQWQYSEGWRRGPALQGAARKIWDYSAARMSTQQSAPSGLADSFEKRKAAWTGDVLARGECGNVDAALILLKHGRNIDKVNTFLSGKVRPLADRSLDVQIYYVLLSLKNSKLSDEARTHLEKLCDRRYGTQLPPHASLQLPFDPWNYQLCAIPTENHLFNDVSCRLADTVIHPDRTYSDGHTAAEYRPYWEDAFRQLVASRLIHGMREWRSTVYCHVVFADAMMIYSIMPDGPTRDAARTFLDYLFLSIGISLRGELWTGPHSRVYNGNGFGYFNFHPQVYGYLADCLLGRNFPGPIAISDYAIPEAIRRLPFREDDYVSIEKVGPRFHPRGEGAGVFNPGKFNVYICNADREDWGGDGLVYNYLTPRYGLGSVQDWGSHDGEWHMHCLPWNLMIASGVGIDLVTSFTGSVEQSAHQGGYGTWANDVNDQDATIFQYRKTLFCQMRGYRHEKLYEILWDGYPEAPWANASERKRLMGYRGKKTLFNHRFYIGNTIGELAQEKGWIFGQKAGVYLAIRAVRGGLKQEQQPDWVPGRVFACDIWDDVVLCEVGEAKEFGSYDRFRQKVLEAPLDWDDKTVTFTNLEGRKLRFMWKEDGDPTVDGIVPEYGGARYRDPCVSSDMASGIIEINCDGARAVLRAHEPDNLKDH